MFKAKYAHILHSTLNRSDLNIEKLDSRFLSSANSNLDQDFGEKLDINHLIFSDINDCTVNIIKLWI